jgi:hypothetical protein
MKIWALFLAVLLTVQTAIVKPAKADFWGGDIPLLMEIVVNTAQQLIQIKNMLQNGRDTLGLLRDVNEGIREAMGIIRTLNTTIRGGMYSQYQTPEQVLNAIQNLYGLVPKTTEAQIQNTHDQAVAEAIELHNDAFRYADMVDPEAERIKDYSRGVSPAGAGRLTAQSLGVLIHVSNQILRTNAAMLKLLGQNLALQNRQSKLSSEQYRVQYQEMSKALGNTKPLAESSNLLPAKAEK